VGIPFWASTAVGKRLSVSRAVASDKQPASENEGDRSAASSGILHHGRDRRLSWRPIAAVIVYAGLGLAANWPTWPGDPSRIRYGDLEQMTWYLAWTPYALLHGHNIFATTWLNYPMGINLVQNTSAPLLGLLTAPLTLLVSPIASLNLLLWLAFPLSAASMFFVLRRWVTWDVAAFVGGALYGFSPYVVTQSLDHLNLAFVPLPPLILLAAYETLRPGQEHPQRWGAALGAFLVSQFFISAEVAATTVIVTGVAMVVLVIASPRQVRLAARQGRLGLLVAVAIVAVCIAYPVWVMLAGPHRYLGPPYPGGVSADLLGTVAPTSMQQFAPGPLAQKGSKLLFGNITENGSYLGLPLLVVMAVIVVQCRHRRWVRFAALMTVATTLLSFGSRLVVANHTTSIPLPFALLGHLPLVGNVIAARFALYTALFAALLVALGMDEMRTRVFARGAERSAALRRGQMPTKSPAALGLWVVGILAIACVISLVPRWPFSTSATAVPAYFSSDSLNRVPASSIVLISPYPSVESLHGQLWQAVAGMRFRIIGGYGLFPGPDGSATNFPAILRPEDVQRFLWSQATGGAAYPSGPIPSSKVRLACDLQAFLGRQSVGTVLATPLVAEPEVVNSLFAQALGKPSMTVGTVTAWYDVQRDIRLHAALCTS
jgi:hypothetical protein